MKKLNLKDVRQYVEENIGVFHEKRIQSLDSLKLSQVLKRKNPYLFKAKHVLTSEQIIKSLIDAHISSSEEGIFGDWLEGLAIFINEKVYGGRKSGITGIDLEFDSNGTRNIVTIKSGPNWGNSSQIAKMRSDFTTAKKTLRVIAPLPIPLIIAGVISCGVFRCTPQVAYRPGYARVLFASEIQNENNVLFHYVSSRDG